MKNNILMKRKSLLLVACMMAFMLLFVGCGNNEDDSADSGAQLTEMDHLVDTLDKVKEGYDNNNIDTAVLDDAISQARNINNLMKESPDIYDTDADRYNVTEAVNRMEGIDINKEGLNASDDVKNNLSTLKSLVNDMNALLNN